MASIPSGTVTFLFTDIEGSTRLLDALGDRYVDVLARHRQLILDACVRRNGYAVNREGDALFVAFAGAADAAGAAIDAQLALGAEPWGTVPVRVRMGLHTGEAQVADDDYVGMPVHIAARIAAAGHGGQILVSDITHQLAGEPDALDLGVHRLKDVGEHRLRQLVADGLDRDLPPLRTLTAHPNNLPAAVDAFVGRQVELDHIAAAIGESRLVTLTGPGGSGKTRLALEAGASLLSTFAHGVWLVSLAAVTDGAGVLPAVVSTLRINPRPGQAEGDALAERLHECDLLLLLDNCEHVIDAVTAFCDQQLPAAPGLRILATSREFLGVRGELAIRTPPLTIPDDPSLAPMSDAVELFLARAHAGAPEFDRGAVDIDTIVHICRRLDGLPLAIELAASRLRALSLQQLAARLDDRFRLLTGGSRSDLPRQRTLEAVVAWSYDLLSEVERDVFGRLAVFPHHFSLEMAESVVAGEPVREADIVEIVARLVEKSLVTTVIVDAQQRYRLLETLRQYALDRLLERAEVDEWRGRLADWSLRVAAHVEVALRTPAMDRLLRDATTDAVTHRAAQTWAAEHGRELDALRIAGAIPLASAADRLAVLQELLGRIASADDLTLGYALSAVGNLAFDLSEWRISSDANLRARGHFVRAGNARQAAWSKYMQAHSEWGAGDVECVDALIAEAIDDFRATRDRMGLGYTLWVASLRAADVDVAERLAAEADDLLRSEDAPMGIAHNVEGRGIIALDRGDLVAAAGFVSEAVRLFALYENAGCCAHALEVAAVVLARSGCHPPAAELLGAAEDMRHRSGNGHRPWEIRARHGAIEDELELDVATLERTIAIGQRHTVGTASAFAIEAIATALAGYEEIRLS